MHKKFLSKGYPINYRVNECHKITTCNRHKQDIYWENDMKMTATEQVMKSRIERGRDIDRERARWRESRL